MQTIQDAIRSRSQTCELNQRRVNVDTNAAIFITLNPVGKGYGGRQRMPDNLKVCFINTECLRLILATIPSRCNVQAKQLGNCRDFVIRRRL